MDVANYDANAFCNLKGKTFFELEVLMFPFSSFYAKILQQGVKSFRRAQTYRITPLEPEEEGKVLC